MFVKFLVVFQFTEHFSEHIFTLTFKDCKLSLSERSKFQKPTLQLYSKVFQFDAMIFVGTLRQLAGKTT